MPTLTQAEAADWSQARSDMIEAERSATVENLEREEADAPTPEDERAREADVSRKRESRAKAKKAKSKAEPPPDDESAAEEAGDLEEQDAPSGEGADDKESDAEDGDKDAKDDKSKAKKDAQSETAEQKELRQHKAALKDSRAKQRAAEARLAEQEQMFTERLRSMEKLFDAASAQAPKPAEGEGDKGDPFAAMPQIDRALIEKIRMTRTEDDPFGKINAQNHLIEQLAAKIDWYDEQYKGNITRNEERTKRESETRAAQQKRESFIRDVANKVMEIAPLEAREHIGGAYNALLAREMQSVVRQNRQQLQAWANEGYSKEALDEWITSKANYALHEDAAELIRAGEDPSEHIFEQAKAIGWSPASTAHEEEGGALSAETPDADDLPDVLDEEPERQIERLRENRRAAGPGANGGGSPRSAIISIEDVAGIEDEGERHALFMKYHAQRKAAARKNPRAVG